MALVSPFTGYRPPVQQTPQQQAAGLSVSSAAAAYAQQRAGYSPHAVMQEGTVTVQNGVPGVMIKYNVAGGGSSTEWTPLPGYQGGNVDMNAIGGGGGGSSAAGGGFPGGASYVGMRGLNPFVSQILSLVSAAGQRPSWAGASSAPDASPGDPGWVAPSGSDWTQQPGFFESGNQADPLAPRYEGAQSLEQLLKVVRNLTQSARGRLQTPS